MKRILSLTLALSLILSSFAFSVLADDAAQLKTVTVENAKLTPAFSPEVYSYDIIVDDEEAALPEIEYTLKDLSSTASVIKEAEVLGDYTEIKVTATDSTENVYKFIYRAPYGISASPTNTPINGIGSSVRGDRPTYTMGDATRNYTWLLKAANSTYPAGLTYMPIYKFSIADVENIDSFGKFELRLAFHTKPSANIDIAIKDTTAVDTWEHSTTYDTAFGKGNTAPLKSEGAVVYNTENASTKVSGYFMAYIDITSLVKKKYAENDTTFTLAVDVPENIAAEFKMFNHVVTNTALRPAILCYPIVKSSEASLKSVTIANGIMDKEFDPATYEYTVGVAEGEEATIKYVLENSHANVEYTPGAKVGETAIVKVTSQDESTEKTYTFNFISYADFGITEAGEFKVKETFFTNGEGKIDTLTSGDEIKFNASATNLNINKKNVTLVTVVKKDGTIIEDGVKIKTIENIKTGNVDLSSDKIELPANVSGVTVEGYIFETDKELPLCDKAAVPASTPAATVTEATKAIEFKADGSNLTIYGKGTPSSYVPVVLIAPEKTLADITKTNTSAVAGFDLVKANSEGIWETTVGMPTANGYYTAYIPADEDGERFLYAKLSDKVAIINNVYAEIYETSDKTTALSNIKTILGLTDSQNINDEILAVETNVYPSLREEKVIALVYGLSKEENSVKPEASTEDDVLDFVALYNKAVFIAKLNAGIKIPVVDIIDYFGFTDLTAIHDLVSASSSASVDESILNNDIETIEELYDVVRTNVIIDLIVSPENVSSAKSALETYGESIGISLVKYNSVAKKDALVQELVNNGPYATVALLQSKLDSLSVKYQKPAAPAPSGGGGGGGGSTTPIITPAQGTGTGGQGAHYTDEFKPESGKYFGDVESDHWAYEPTKFLNEKGILKGMDNGNFEPSRSIKREEFAKILVLAFGLKTKGEDKAFADVSENEWYYEYVKIASENGIINGIGEGVFGAGSELSRQDIAVMLARVLDKTETSDEAFADDNEISDYAKDAVYTLKSLGILNGTGNGSFEPKRAVTRAECAKIVYELIKE